MQSLAWAFACVFFCLAATAVQAAELEGFGPIKFGMTKKEAMAAINGEGRWETDDRLDYSYYWVEFDEKFIVNQFFRDGLANEAKIYSESKQPFWYLCVASTLRIIGTIKKKYQKTPVIRDGLNNNWRLGGVIKKYTTDSYFFGFEHGAFIAITNWMSEESRDCELTIHYYPAYRNSHPF